MQMGFNFGQFLGGMSRQISENIESAKEFEREKQFRLDMLAEEEATKMRLQRSAERRAQRKKDTENASVLKAMGYTDAQAGWIMKGGDATVSLYTKFAEQAFTRGISPSTILGSNLVNSDQQDPRNEASLMSVIDSTRPEIDPDDQPFTIRQDVMTSVLGEIKEPKEPKQYGSLEAGHAGTYSLLQDAKQKANSNPTKENLSEVSRLEDVLLDWKKKIEEDIALRKPEDKDPDVKYFSDASRPTIVKNELADAYREYEFETDIDGNITAKLEGRRGVAIVARISASDSIESIANVAPNAVDQRLVDRATRMRTKAENELRNYGRGIVSTDGSPDEATSKFSYLKNTKEEATNKLIPMNYRLATKMANNGQLKVGDVVVVRLKENGVVVDKIKVYTGLRDPDDQGVEVQGQRLFDLFYDAGSYSPSM